MVETPLIIISIKVFYSPPNPFSKYWIWRSGGGTILIGNQELNPAAWICNLDKQFFSSQFQL